MILRGHTWKKNEKILDHTGTIVFQNEMLCRVFFRLSLTE